MPDEIGNGGDGSPVRMTDGFPFARIDIVPSHRHGFFTFQGGGDPVIPGRKVTSVDLMPDETEIGEDGSPVRMTDGFPFARIDIVPSHRHGFFTFQGGGDPVIPGRKVTSVDLMPDEIGNGGDGSPVPETGGISSLRTGDPTVPSHNHIL